MASEKPSPSEARAALGLTAVATPAQVTTAFRHQARLVHPDISHARDAAGRFASLVAAYRVALQAAQGVSESNADLGTGPRVRSGREPPAHGLHDVVTGPAGTVVWEAGQPVLVVAPVRVAPLPGRLTGGRRRDDS